MENTFHGIYYADKYVHGKGRRQWYREKINQSELDEGSWLQSISPINSCQRRTDKLLWNKGHGGTECVDSRRRKTKILGTTSEFIFSVVQNGKLTVND